MGRKVKPDGLGFMVQALDVRPVGDLGQRIRGHRRRVVAEQADLVAFPVMGLGAGMAQEDVDALENLPAVGIQAVEGARPGQVFQLPPVDGLGIQAPGEVEQVLERTVRPALGDHLFHGRFADVLDRGERITDGPRAGAVALDGEHRVRRVDVGG